MSSSSVTRRTRRAAAIVAALPALALAVATPSKAGTPPVSVIAYDSSTQAQYDQKWSPLYGDLDHASLAVDGNGATVSDAPFKSGVDFSVFDHLKYFRVSSQTFPAPANGSVAFSADITASTPGTEPSHVVHGQYGPPGSYSPTSGQLPYSAPVLEGQQAGVVLNMIDFCSGQLFDWFVSGTSAFPLIERLPTSVTGNTSNKACSGAHEVGPDLMYTQIIRTVPLKPGVPHNVAIAFSQSAAAGRANVTYLLDGLPVASVNHVGIPLDKQGMPFSGTYASLGNGEELAGQIHSFSIGHGLFSLLDAFPFQYGCTPPSATGPGTCVGPTAGLSVSLPPSERAFGQGAIGTFAHFRVLTVGS